MTWFVNTKINCAFPARPTDLSGLVWSQQVLYSCEERVVPFQLKDVYHSPLYLFPRSQPALKNGSICPGATCLHQSNLWWAII